MTSRSLPTKNEERKLHVCLGKGSSFFQLGSSPSKSLVTMLLTVIFILLGAVNAEYANQWTVTVRGTRETADEVARLHGFENRGKLFEDEDVYMFVHHSVMKRSLSSAEEIHSNLISHGAVVSAEQQIIKKRVKRSLDFDPVKGPNDPLWSQTWYLLRQTKPSMKVSEAWEAGYTGKNVVVTILDDGIEYTHPDLAKNYDKLASSDINGNDDDPEPRPTYNNENRHGTRCAGEVAAVANNKQCSVGIAFNAKIGGVRMLDGQVTDMVEAKSIGLNPQHIDIYSASWGPDDDGRTVDGPATRAKQAFMKGVTQGRGGKGSIFVWASGNGGRKYDNCNCDGYTNSIYTLSISSTTEKRKKPWYSEACSSTLATTYSSGFTGDKQIVTTDLSGRCTTKHTGTSASAPLAAGICALALEANPKLTWRDMQHLVVRTANPEELQADDWVVNGVRRNVSHSYGYGLMDAYAMVMLAKDWVPVPQQRRCNITILDAAALSRQFSSGSPLRIPFDVSKCDGVLPDKLEHVQAEISATSTKRGDLHIYLTSPMGTRSTLLDDRTLDNTQAGFNNWPFMTTHNWDENPNGQWVLEVQTRSSRGSLTFFQLVMYGTLQDDWPPGSISSPTIREEPAIDAKSQTTSARNGPFISNTDKSTAPTQETTTASCETRDKSGKLCLVCESGSVRDLDKTHCLRKCPPGQFAAFEKVAEEIPRAGKAENAWESLQEARFEDEERFDGVKVCKRCAAGPYCVACDGPTVSDCLWCADGFKVFEGQCVLDPLGAQSERRKVYMLSVAVCVLSVVVFIFLFIFLQCCRRQRRCCAVEAADSKPLYKYVPNHGDRDDINDGLFGEPGLKFAKGRKLNGVRNGHSDKRPLLDSDEERN